ncbi:hypothetical protein PVAG01_05235 [Phlyctema vagabunda]|uniref:Uncharacterized protein n=1 Tax=Phlyctema vagabunda TaxID=108571 RepID=A0ABR4PJU6_9HELO
MFSSSVRRAALQAPQIPFPSLSSVAPRAAASQALSHRSHQRRCSSSKPSSPADGSNGISSGQSVPPGTVQAGAEGEKKKSADFSKANKAADGSKSAAEGRAAPAETRSQSEKKSAAPAEKKTATRNPRRKNASKTEIKNEAMRNLPSVPSTQHVAPSQISVASFFSLHRPISLTMGVPKKVTDQQFEAIFKSRLSTNARPSEVISTLSSTVENLSAASNGLKRSSVGQQAQWNAETDELRAAITSESYRKAEAQHLDQNPSESDFQFPQHILTGRYQPFTPPPPPVPMNTAESLAAGAEAAEALEPQQKTYTAVLTIEESTNENGEVTYMAHSSPFVEEPPMPTRFLGRMKIRQERYEEYRDQRSEENRMETLSVKRQRKLKMASNPVQDPQKSS